MTAAMANASLCVYHNVYLLSDESRLGLISAERDPHPRGLCVGSFDLA